VLGLETVRGIRVVGDADALDVLVGAVDALVMRLAPDDAFVVLEKPDGRLDPEYPAAILVEETGFVGCWLTAAQLALHVIPHVDWALPDARPALAQGLIAGVPCKLWLESGRALLLCAGPYAHELVERLG
jgi:hypothetical protein